MSWLASAPYPPEPPGLLKRAWAILLGVLALVGTSLVLGLVANHVAPEPVALLAPWHVDPALPEVTPQRAHELYDTGQAVFLDARTRKEYEQERIPFAFTLPVAEAEEGVPNLDGLLSHARYIVVYCDGPSCGASFQVGQELLRNGYTAVHLFTAGLPGWKQAGFPTETGAPSP